MARPHPLAAARGVDVAHLRRVTLLDGLLLHLLPPIGTGVDLIPAILLATFGNLVLIAVVAPWLARRTWERRPAAEPARRRARSSRCSPTASAPACCWPRSSAWWRRGSPRDPTVVSETEDTERNAKAFRSLILSRGDEELIRNLETANTVRLGEDFFRTCVARDDRQRYFCAFIDTSKDPDVDVDPSAEPNSA